MIRRFVPFFFLVGVAAGRKHIFNVPNKDDVGVGSASRGDNGIQDKIGSSFGLVDCPCKCDPSTHSDEDCEWVCDCEEEKRQGVTMVHLEEQKRQLRQESLKKHERRLQGFVSMSLPMRVRRTEEIKKGSRNRALAASYSKEQDQPTAIIDEALEATMPKGFDFVIAGFPHCGEKSIRVALEAHEEIDMVQGEMCVISSSDLSENAVQKSLQRELAELDSTPGMSRGLACSDALLNSQSIERMERISPGSKFVVGVRHPVLMLQDYYNHLVSDIHNQMLNERIPSFHEVMAADMPWKGLSPDLVRYELFLMQFGKTNMSLQQMKELAGYEGYDISLQPNDISIFLYSQEQLDAENEMGSERLEQDLASFLELSTPLMPFSRNAQNHLLSSKINSHVEAVDICNEQYEGLRGDIIESAKKTSTWIIDSFMKSNSVVVGDTATFIHSLRAWGHDPCLSTAEALLF